MAIKVGNLKHGDRFTIKKGYGTFNDNYTVYVVAEHMPGGTVAVVELDDTTKEHRFHSFVEVEVL